MSRDIEGKGPMMFPDDPLAPYAPPSALDPSPRSEEMRLLLDWEKLRFVYNAVLTADVFLSNNS